MNNIYRYNINNGYANTFMERGASLQCGVTLGWMDYLKLALPTVIVSKVTTVNGARFSFMDRIHHFGNDYQYLTLTKLNKFK
jgi:hypothetical protein